MAPSHSRDRASVDDGDDEIAVIDIQEWAVTQEEQRILGIEKRVKEFVAPSGRSRHMSVDDREAEEKIEEELLEGIDCIDLTADEDVPPPRRASSTPKPFSRNASLDPNTYAILLNFENTNGIELAVNKVVEVREPLGYYDIQFIKISAIVQHKNTGEVIIRGFPYTRARNLRGLLARKLNEVVQIIEIDENDPRPIHEQAAVEIKADDVFKQRYVHTTNRPFPQVRLATDWNDIKTKQEVEDDGPLVCRWNHLLYYRDAARRKTHKPLEYVLEHVREDESQAKHAIKDSYKRDAWRGTEAAIAVDEDNEHKHGYNKDQNPPPRPSRPRYTAADLFCGAGGASRGIERAGFELTLAVDHWPHACRSYHANFRRVELLERDVHDFINDKGFDHREQPSSAHPQAARGRSRPDVLHISPPCQVWSPAHTIAGKNDSANEAVLFACGGLMKKLRPRVFTLEQTFGILHKRFELYFNILVQGFTDLGYSVRWRVVHLVTLGLPQPRRRLVMIGSCPGEKLPSFPPATNSGGGGGSSKVGGSKFGSRSGSCGGGLATASCSSSAAAGALRPPVTVNEALSRIVPGAGITLHNPEEMKPIDRPPWDANRVLPRSITCSGGQNYYPDGNRDFTLREYAVLQGFPTWHLFESSYIKKQIGNAFPPCVVRVIYEHIKRHLMKEDGITEAMAGEVSPSPDGCGVTVEVKDDDDGCKGRVVVDLDTKEGDSDDDVVMMDCTPVRAMKAARQEKQDEAKTKDDDDDLVMVDWTPIQSAKQSQKGKRKEDEEMVDDAASNTDSVTVAGDWDPMSESCNPTSSQSALSPFLTIDLSRGT